MLRKYIGDLNDTELKEVFYSNMELQSMVRNDFSRTGSSYSSDRLENVTDHFVNYYAHEYLSDAFIEGESFTLYEQRTYNFDDGGFISESEKVLDKGNEIELLMDLLQMEGIK